MAWQPVENPWDKLAARVAATAPQRRAAAAAPCFGCHQPVDRTTKQVAAMFGVDGFLDSCVVGALGFEQDRYKARQVLSTAFGHEGLGAVADADAPSTIMIRASNLSNVLVVGLRIVPEKLRSAALARATDPVWAQRALRLAKGVGLGLEDAVRFSLAMSFVIGIIDADSGRDSLEARVYKKVVAGYKAVAANATPISEVEAKSRLRGVVAAPQLRGLGALGDGPKCADWDLLCHAGNAIGGVAKAAEQAGKNVQQAVEKAFDWSSDMLCKGLKWLLGEQFGGVLCAIFSTYLNMLKFIASALIGVATEVARTLKDVITLLMQNKPKEAGLAFLKGVTTIVFLMPPIGPTFALLLGVTITEMTDMARKVADKAPLFVVQVAAAIFGVLAPTPQSVVGVVQALRPAVAVFAGAAVAKAFKLLSATQTENAIDSIVSFGCGITLGVVTIAGVATDMAKAVEKSGDIGAAAQAKFEELKRTFEAKWNRVGKAFETFNFKEVVLAISDLAGMEQIAGKVLKAAEDAPNKISETLDDIMKKLSPTELIAKLELNQLPEAIAAAAAKVDPAKLAAQIDPGKLVAAFIEKSKGMAVPQKASAVADFLRSIPAAERGAFLTELRKAGV